METARTVLWWDGFGEFLLVNCSSWNESHHNVLRVIQINTRCSLDLAPFDIAQTV